MPLPTCPPTPALCAWEPPLFHPTPFLGHSLATVPPAETWVAESMGLGIRKLPSNPRAPTFQLGDPV